MNRKIDLRGLLYPARCALCDARLGRGERLLCEKCRTETDPRLHLFEGGFAPFGYRSVEKRAVLRMKYADRPEYAGFFAASILLVGREMIEGWKAEAVVPVPIHRRRLVRRGFNQAEEIAGHLAACLRLPLRADLLLRARNTRPQSDLDHAGRRENLRGAIVCRLIDDMPARILLVDDIYTSGATAREAALALRAAGAREVHIVCATLAG